MSMANAAEVKVDERILSVAVVDCVRDWAVVEIRVGGVGGRNEPELERGSEIDRESEERVGGASWRRFEWLIKRKRRKRSPTVVNEGRQDKHTTTLVFSLK